MKPTRRSMSVGLFLHLRVIEHRIDVKKMLQKKICLLGSFGVGKTSLVSQYVFSKFSEKYLSTVGVKIDRKDVQVNGQDIRLMLWDIHGQDEFQEVRQSYLRGMAGFLLVVDGTRPETLSTAREMHLLAQDAVGQVPFVLLINKVDLTSHWKLDPNRLASLVDESWEVKLTSAKTGANVEEAFTHLASQLLS